MGEYTFMFGMALIIGLLAFLDLANKITSRQVDPNKTDVSQK